ncbi:YdcF family protein [Actinomycetes bacterium M1A6_2h]
MIALATIPVALTVALGVTGFFLFTRAHIDPAQKADAIIVLGGEHDGREAFGMRLAEQGYADTVVLSNPYPSTDSYMRWLCDGSTSAVTVLCEVPQPSTTRGEAIFTQRLAQQRGWTHVIVVTWQFHLPRARFIFDQCFGGSLTMVAVPRHYDYSLADWEFTYLYQFAGFAKAVAEGPRSCDTDVN